MDESITPILARVQTANHFWSNTVPTGFKALALKMAQKTQSGHL